MQESGFRDGVYVPPSQRTPLHKTRMGVSVVREVEQESAPVWVERKGGGRFEYRPVERPAEPQASPLPQQTAPANDGLQQQINILTTAVARQLGIEPDTGPKPPNPAEFDFYDPESAEEYRRRNDIYMQGEVERQVNAQLEPHREAMLDAELRKQYNDCLKEFGDDPNFQAIMNLALMECNEAANSGKDLAIRDAFIAVSDPANARPGKRNAHLPQALYGRVGPNGKKHLPSLKDIIIHNRLTGRSNSK